jgi:hypothetical protein
MMIGEKEEGGCEWWELGTYNSCDWGDVSHSAMSRQTVSQVSHCEQV